MAFPKRVLVIGSSSIGENGSGALGKALRRILSGVDVSFFGKSGAGFDYFAGTPAKRAVLEKVLLETAPDLVLVVMGGNPTGTAIALGDMMQWLKNAVGSKELLWVGPPVYADVSTQGITRLYDNIGPRVLGSAYTSSQNWTQSNSGRTADRVHFTDFGAQQWGQKIVEWMRERTSPSLWWVLASTAAVGFGAWFWFSRRAA